MDNLKNIIKFKGVDKLSDRVIYGSLSISNDGRTFINDEYWNSLVEIKAHTVSQFWREIAGVELWEGDTFGYYNVWTELTEVYKVSRYQGTLTANIIKSETMNHHTHNKDNLIVIMSSNGETVSVHSDYKI